MTIPEFATQLGLSQKTIRRYIGLGYIDADKVPDPRGFRYEISPYKLPKVRKLHARNMATLADRSPNLTFEIMKRRDRQPGVR